MNRSISSYEELLEEKARLNALLSAQKNLVRQDINMIKAELVPVRKALNVASKFASRENRNDMLTIAADAIIDMVIKRIILSKAGFITRTVVPFLMKNFSSHVIADNKDKIINMITSLFSKKHENGTYESGENAFESESNDPLNEEEEED